MIGPRAIPTLGAQADRYLLDHHPGPLAGQGQFTLHRVRGLYVGRDDVADRHGWPVDVLGAPTMDWADGDGLAPHVGPALALTGTVTAGKLTPWRRRDGSTVTASRFSAGSWLRTAGPLDPALNEDVVGAILIRPDGSASHSYISTYNAGRSWAVYSTGVSIVLYVMGNALIQSTGPYTPWGWLLVSWTIARGGQQVLYLNGAQVDSDAAPAGSIASGATLTLGANSDGSASGLGAIARNLLWYGAGAAALAPPAWHRALADAVLGLLADQGAAIALARASARCYYPLGPTGRVHVLGQATPPAGGPEGLGAGEQIVSVASRNHGFVAADGTLLLADRDAGLTISADPVDDSAALDPVVPDAGGLALQVNNPTGGPLVVRLPNAIGGAPAVSWGSIRIRKIAAGVVRLGWHTAAGVFTQIAADCSDNYARTSGTALPALATNKIALELAAGSSVRLVLYCHGVGARVPDEVPSRSGVGAGYTVLQDVWTPVHVQSDPAETYEVEVVPRLWGGAAPASTSILRGAALDLIGIDATGRLQTQDGVNTLNTGVVATLTDGVQTRLRAAHGSGRQSIGQAGGAEATGPYDGTVPAPLTLRGGPWAIRGVSVLRNFAPNV